MITLDLFELKNICMQMSELGAANYAKRFTPAQDNISQRAAFRRFGEQRVKSWAQRRLIGKTRNGKTENSKILYSFAELLAADAAEKINQSINQI